MADKRALPPSYAIILTIDRPPEVLCVLVFLLLHAFPPLTLASFSIAVSQAAQQRNVAAFAAVSGAQGCLVEPLTFAACRVGAGSAYVFNELMLSSSPLVAAPRHYLRPHPNVGMEDPCATGMA